MSMDDDRKQRIATFRFGVIADLVGHAEVLYKGKSYGFPVPVNLAVNCRAKRDKNNNVRVESSSSRNGYKGGSLWRKGDEE
jgi:hypothetical protein